MAVNAAGAANSTYNASSTSGITSDAIKKSADQFMMILLAQLKNQNPLEPMKDNEMMTQMTQLNSLQELQSMNQKIDQLASASSASYATSLIGKQVKARLSDGTDVEGLVDGMAFQDGLYVLNIGDKEIPLSAILEVSTPPQAEATAAATAAAASSATAASTATTAPTADEPQPASDSATPVETAL